MNLKPIISKFPKSNILVIGDLILDEFIWGEVDRISPEAPVPVVWAKRRSFMPGGACNVADNISSLGGRVSLSGVIGSDSHGRSLLSELKKRNVDTKGIFQDSSRPTTLKTRIVAQHQQLVRLDWEDRRRIASSAIKNITNFIRKNLDRFDAVIIEDYGKGVVTKDLLCEISSLVKHKKILTVDPKEEHFAMYKGLGLTAITPNRKETENAIRNIKISDNANSLNIYNDKLNSDKEINLAGRELLRYLNAEAILITLGEKGMRLFEDNGKTTQIDTVAQEVFDVSGAGDTVIATFTLALASGASRLASAHLANFAAGIVVGKVGVATVTQKELLERMKQ